MNPSLLCRIWLVSLSCLLPLRAGETELRDLLRDALYTEEVARDPDKAAKQYEELLSRYAEQKQFAASALFRLAEVRRKQNRKDDAIALYQRLLTEFPNAEAETRLAKENLAALGGKMPETGGAVPVVEDEETKEIQRLRKLAETSPDLAWNPDELTEAVNNDRLRVVEFLLDSGMKGSGSGALVLAARRGNLKILKTLIHEDGEMVTAEGTTALAAAVAEGHAEAARALLEAKVDPNWQPDASSTPLGIPKEGLEPPLMMAVHNGSQAIIDLLLEAKADVKLPANGTGLTALHLAAGRTTKDAPALVERLIDLGADVNALSAVLPAGSTRPSISPPNPNDPPRSLPSTKISPLQYAVECGAWDCAKTLIRRGADLKQPALFDLFLKPEIRDSDPAKILFLLENGADPNNRDLEGKPAVVQVLSQGRVDLLNGFLKHGLDPNLTCGTIKMSREPGHGDPFAETTGKWEEYAEPLVASFGTADKKRQFELIRILLGAGAKPGPLLWSVLWRVAQQDESGEWTRKLLADAPEVVNPDAFAVGFMEGWLPEPRRVFLDEVALPALAKTPGIKLVHASTGKRQVLVEASDGGTPPATIDFLKNHIDDLLPDYREKIESRSNYEQALYWPKLTLFRLGDDGKPVRQEIDLLGDSPLPGLRMGDVIELGKMGSPVSKYKEGDLIRIRFDWHLHKRISFPVTLEIGGKEHEITLRGGLLVFDPTRNEAPLVHAGPLANLFVPDLPEDAELVVKREGWNEIHLPVSQGGASQFALQPGDRLVIPSVPETKRNRESGSGLTIPGYPFVRYGSVSYAPTLVEAITDAYAPWAMWEKEFPDSLKEEDLFPWISNRLHFGHGVPVPVIPPLPDFSRIRIRRLGEDGKESVIDVDLAAAMRRCTVDTLPEEARKADMILQGGDLVELSLKEGLPGKPWSGFSEEETRFFGKVLAGRVVINKGQGSVEQKEIRYMPPAWRATAHGLLPLPPKDGLMTTRLQMVTGGVSVENVEIIRSNGTTLKQINGDPFVRDGDQINIKGGQPRPGVIPPGPRREPRPRVVPPPSN